jgi:hypothetical protein
MTLHASQQKRESTVRKLEPCGCANAVLSQLIRGACKCEDTCTLVFLKEVDSPNAPCVDERTRGEGGKRIRVKSVCICKCSCRKLLA